MARIKGQEVKIVATGPGGVEDGIQDIVSFNAELDIEILEEAYLGETANRFDDIYNGTGGDAEMHIESSKFFQFVERVKDRAQRRDPASGQFSVVGAFAFPNGTRMRLLFEDVFWGAMPITVGSRKDYVKVRIEWKCSNFRRIG